MKFDQFRHLAEEPQGNWNPDRVPGARVNKLADHILQNQNDGMNHPIHRNAYFNRPINGDAVKQYVKDNKLSGYGKMDDSFMDSLHNRIRGEDIQFAPARDARRNAGWRRDNQQQQAHKDRIKMHAQSVVQRGTKDPELMKKIKDLVSIEDDTDILQSQGYADWQDKYDPLDIPANREGAKMVDPETGKMIPATDPKFDDLFKFDYHTQYSEAQYNQGQEDAYSLLDRILGSNFGEHISWRMFDDQEDHLQSSLGDYLLSNNLYDDPDEFGEGQAQRDIDAFEQAMMNYGVTDHHHMPPNAEIPADASAGSTIWNRATGFDDGRWRNEFEHLEDTGMWQSAGVDREAIQHMRDFYNRLQNMQ